MGQEHQDGFLSAVAKHVVGLADWRGIDRNRRTYRILTLVLFGIAVIGQAYRDYVWSHGVQDFGLADAWPNIVAVPALVFEEMGFRRQQPERISTLLSWAVGSLILYETIQLTGFLGSVFDWRDIIGTLLGVPITVMVYRYACRPRNTSPVDR